METTTVVGNQAPGRITQGVRAANQERYERVNKAWPASTPPLTFDEGRLAAKKLWRIATGKPWPQVKRWSQDVGKMVNFYQIKQTGGNRYTKFADGVLSINPANGWNDLVHTISHRTWNKVCPPGHAGHGTGHASHEHMLIQEVIRRGWLEGKLKRPEKPKVVKDIKFLRYQAALTKQKQWLTKAKRAATALKKIKQTINYYEKEALKIKST